jgi:hypothetical protein
MATTAKSPAIELRNNLDYENEERNDLLTGEPRHPEDETRNAFFAMVFGALGGLFCLVACILCWFLYFRERTRTFLWHAIIMIFVTLFAFAAAGWGASARTALRDGKLPSNNFTLIIFLGSLICVGYCLAMGMWLLFYRPVHFNYLRCIKADQDTWNTRMPTDVSFADGWKSSRRLMWWTALFTVLGGLCFAFLAFATRSVVGNRVALTRAGLYLALLAIVVAGFFMIYWAEEAYEIEKIVSKDFAPNFAFYLKIAAIIGITLAVINAIINFIKFKAGYFICAIVLIVFLIIVVVLSGTLFRTLRKRQFSKYEQTNCAQALAPIHEDAFANLCPTGGKYLPAGQTCRKEDLVQRWEGDGGQRSLNPAACGLSNYFVMHPFLQLGFWSLILLMATCVAIGSNFYLSDTSEYLASIQRKVDLIDIIGLLFIILAVIALILYFWIRKPNTLGTPSNTLAKSFEDPVNNPIDGFKVVPTSVKNAAPVTAGADECLSYTNYFPTPTFSAAAPATCTSNCIQRVALLAQKATFKVGASAGTTEGPADSRLLFFPGCQDVSRDYKFVYGTAEQIKNYLATLRVCPTSLNTPPVVVTVQDQIASDKLLNTGLAKGETYTAPTNGAETTCFDGFINVNSCAGNCKVWNAATDSQVLKPLKGRLFYLKNGLPNLDLHRDLTIKAINSKTNARIGGDVDLFAEGVFVVKDIPRIRDSDYLLTLLIEDPKGIFLNKRVDVRIQRELGQGTELSAGEIRLDTRDATVCDYTLAAADLATCLDKQSYKNGTITLNLKDTEGKPVAGAQGKLLRGHGLSGQVISTKTSDAEGNLTFADTQYDAYTIETTKDAFNPEVSFVDLQEANHTVKPVTLRPTTDGNDLTVFATMPSAGDFDLNLRVKSDTAECTASPTNKFCAYAQHMQDAKNGGQESVAIKNLAVANYLSYISPAPAYAGSCAGADISSDPNNHFAGWNWDEFKKNIPFEKLNFLTGVLGGGNATGVADTLRQAIKFQKPVETAAEAAKLKKLIAVNNRPLS